MPYTRARIQLNSVKDVKEFVESLNSLGNVDKYTVEDFEGKTRVNARSFLGMVYASGEFDELYLINETNDGSFSYLINKFRP